MAEATIVAASVFAAFPLLVADRSSGFGRALVVALVGGLLGGTLSCLAILHAAASRRPRAPDSPPAVDVARLAPTDTLTGAVGGIVALGLIGLVSDDPFESYRPQRVFVVALIAGIAAARALRLRPA